MQIDVSFLPVFAAAFMLSFARIGTMVMLLPGLGEMTVSPRVRLTIALVLTAVFVPVAFLGGLTGQFYKQFALTLSVSVLISAFVALTFTPALCLILLHRAPVERRSSPLTRALQRGYGALL